MTVDDRRKGRRSSARWPRSSTAARPTHGPTAIALEGEAGIGKSTLWRAAVEDARGRGLRVLSSRPAESERALAYAGLGDLLDGVLDDVLPALTPPRRRALEVVLLVEDAAGRPVDPRALGVAVRSALELLAEDELVLAIDDLQWLDASSASALGFALRRLPDGEHPPALDAAARRARAVDRGRGRSRRRPDRTGPGRPAQRRRDASGSAQPARRRSAAADAAAAARGVGREPVLCARARAGARRRGRDSRSDAAAAGARAAGGAGLRAPRRLHRRDARGARARVRGRASDAGAARRRGHRAGRARPGARRARDRARGRHDPLHAPAARVRPLPGAARERAAASPPPPGRARRGSARARTPSRAFDRPCPTPSSRPCSRTRPRQPPRRARRSPPASSASTRSG